MYMKLDQIVNKGEKIVDETERYNYLYNEMEKLFGDQDFILSQVRCGSENDFSVYICMAQLPFAPSCLSVNGLS